MTDVSNQRVGFVGLGDQGGPMALAIVEAGFLLHAWARRPQSYDALGGAAPLRSVTSITVPMNSSRLPDPSRTA
jgi:3-hydroxyisobutyrate dehydrogenase-like beta-hydroxyacid dehydrogenase